ncbi:MAG: SDR family oxidoreductase [Candidatus Aenigmarchaeota archaeon]|nr:SDR family oxidoreductase [Candidatus Aenigmarchaeota archaeon]
MRIVVTGGAGFIGSHLAEELVREGHDVLVYDNLSTGNEAYLKSVKNKIKLVKGDIIDVGQLKKACDGAEALFHLAALKSVPASIQNPIAYFETNITGTFNVLEAARLNGTKKVVFASSSSVYGEKPKIPQKEGKEDVRISPYGISKYAGEDLCGYFNKLYGMQTVALRYFNVFGPRQDPVSQYAAVIPKFILCLLKDEQPPVYGAGAQTRDFTYVKDVVAANLCALKNKNASGVFNIAPGSPISVNVLAQKIAHLLGKQIIPKYFPQRSGDILHSYADITKAKLKLGLQPFTPFDEALAKTIDWFKLYNS